MIRLKMYLNNNPLLDLSYKDDMKELAGERLNKPRMPKEAGSEEPTSFR
ncbi:hypothetical protein [Paenibacillus sp. NPDC058071]